MIYLLEDDESIRKLVVYALESQGFEALGYETPERFWTAMEQAVPDLVLLDIMLPDEDGISILRRLRESASTTHLPVIMLTAKNTEYDRVEGLDAGADDYISKPFGMMELIARVKALLRRAEGVDKDKEYTVGSLHVAPTKHKARVNGKELTLTLKEFELLTLFVENQGIVFTRDQILTKIWGYAFDGESRTVDVHIRSLRQKLGDAGNLIETVRGIGYKLGEA